MTEKVLQEAQEENLKKVMELEAQLKMETELRSLTESYQAELESHLDALRNLNAQPMKKPKKRGVNMNSKK